MSYQPQRTEDIKCDLCGRYSTGFECFIVNEKTMCANCYRQKMTLVEAWEKSDEFERLPMTMIGDAINEDVQSFLIRQSERISRERSESVREEALKVLDDLMNLLNTSYTNETVGAIRKIRERYEKEEGK